MISNLGVKRCQNPRVTADCWVCVVIDDGEQGRGRGEGVKCRGTRRPGRERAAKCDGIIAREV